MACLGRGEMGGKDGGQRPTESAWVSIPLHCPNSGQFGLFYNNSREVPAATQENEGGVFQLNSCLAIKEQNCFTTTNVSSHSYGSNTGCEQHRRSVWPFLLHL